MHFMARPVRRWPSQAVTASLAKPTALFIPMSASRPMLALLVATLACCASVTRADELK